MLITDQVATAPCTDPIQVERPSTSRAHTRHAFKHAPDNLKRQLRHLALRFLRYFPRAFSKLRWRKLLCRSQVRMKTFGHRTTSSTTTLRATQRQIRTKINCSITSKSFLTS